jgi:hypothetical protein
MGAWGTAIFSDDTAQDVRDEWRDAILDRLSAEEATTRLVKSFDDYLGDDEDAEKLFWMALAAAQYETGRLLPEVRNRALAIIDAGGDVGRWLEDGDDVSARQRQRVLERLAAKLRAPQPKPKRIRPSVALSVPFEVGDVIYARDPNDEKADALVVVIGHQKHKRPEELDPIVAGFDWEGGRVPERKLLASLPLVADPIWPDRPLIITVSTHMKKDVFGPQLGEVVANGVNPELDFDPEHVRHYMGWRVVASSVGEAQLMARWRATPEARDG